MHAQIGGNIDKIAHLHVSVSGTPAGAAWHDTHECAARLCYACRSEIAALLTGNLEQIEAATQAREQGERDVHAAFDVLEAELARMRAER